MTVFIPYITFMKHAKKVTKSRAAKTRPVLSAVIHRGDYVAVTDSHRLYKATGLHEGEEKQIDPNTGVEVDHGNYPEIDRLISDTGDAKSTYAIDVTKAYEAIRAIEIAGRVNKATDLMEIKTGDDHLEFKTEDRAAFDVSYKANTSASISDLETTTVNIKYMKEALHVLKDAKVEKATFAFFGNMRPIQIIAGNFTALISPVRTNI